MRKADAPAKVAGLRNRGPRSSRFFRGSALSTFAEFRALGNFGLRNGLREEAYKTVAGFVAYAERRDIFEDSDKGPNKDVIMKLYERL